MPLHKIFSFHLKISFFIQLLNLKASNILNDMFVDFSNIHYKIIMTSSVLILFCLIAKDNSNAVYNTCLFMLVPQLAIKEFCQGEQCIQYLLFSNVIERCSLKLSL